MAERSRQSCGEARRALERAVVRNRMRSSHNVRKVPQPPEVVPSVLDRHRVEHWEMLTTDADYSSQGYLPFRVAKPGGADERRRLPCVIMLHPTGADHNYHVFWEAKLLDRGYLTVSLDMRYHGGRQDFITYQEAIKRSYTDRETFEEKPFLLDNVWDLLHILDVLERRTDVGKIGITGLSLGGMVSWLLAVIDDRVYAPVPLCGVQSFQYALNERKFHERVMSIPDVFTSVAPEGKLSKLTSEMVASVWNVLLPGMLEQYDAPLSLGCIAPRPLLVVTGAHDGKNPLRGVQQAMDAARQAYEAQGLAERLEIFAQEDAGHELTLQMRERIDDWFDRWLL